MDTPTRPLSPHLQIYRPQLTSVLSITHRATGLVLALGTLLVVYWLVALAAGPETYARAHAIIASGLGRVVLFGFTFSLVYHLCNGVRHLLWDAGVGLDLDAAYASGAAVIGVSCVLTVAAWVAAFLVA